MKSLVLHPTSTAQWHALVSEAEKQSTIILDEELESYLVFLLMRFAGNPEMAISVMAIEFLESLDAIGKKRVAQLQEVGDKCLLFSGLFPGRAQRRRVRISYFVQLGQNAYHILSVLQERSKAQLFSELSDKFVSMMDVLQAMRQQTLQPLEAAELWQDTGSQRARDAMKQFTDGMLITSKNNLRN